VWGSSAPGKPLRGHREQNAENDEKIGSLVDEEIKSLAERGRLSRSRSQGRTQEVIPSPKASYSKYPRQPQALRQGSGSRNQVEACPARPAKHSLSARCSKPPTLRFEAALVVDPSNHFPVLQKMIEKPLLKRDPYGCRIPSSAPARELPAIFARSACVNPRNSPRVQS